MNADFIIHALLGLLPVLCFLAALVVLDSYKLVSVKTVVAMIIAGILAAVASYPINSAALSSLAVEFSWYTRYVSPVLEEALKALIVVVLLQRNRIGFLVDAAILGFAVGAGFAIFENLFYLQILPDTRLGTWIVRGFGTAIMHGGATAIFAVTSHALIGQKGALRGAAMLPGFAVAVITHSIFNHFFLSPIQTTLGFLVFLPMLAAAIFMQSEKSVEEWLDVGFDADTELLELINSGQFSSSKVGVYLLALKERFRGEVVADLLCYLRLHVELSIRAKGMLMMRESGFEDEIGEETRAKLVEMKYLDKSIGKTGKLAIKPFMQMSNKDLSQIYRLSS